MAAEPFDDETLAIYQKMFNLSREELNEIISVLAKAEQEAVGSMGDDTPMPVLSKQIRSPFDYFRQQFAQVTNPPIDSLRERNVMSLQTNIGRETSLFDIGPEHASHVIMNSPVLSQRKLRQLIGPDMFADSHAFIDLNLPKDLSLPEALDTICAQADQAVADGKLILMLSDRYLKEDLLPVHALLATGAVHQHLVNNGTRCARQYRGRDRRRPRRAPHRLPDRLRCDGGLSVPRLPVPARPGPAWPCRSPTAARSQLSPRYPQRVCSRSCPRWASPRSPATGARSCSRSSGCRTRSSSAASRARSAESAAPTSATCIRTSSNSQTTAWNPRIPLGQGGLLKYVHGGEYHCFNPDVVMTLQAAVRAGDYDRYRQYASLVNDRPVATLRDLLDVKPLGDPVPLDEVEPVEDIMMRFDSAGMSLGALSPEAHEALAIAMNRIGARSNSGEGGEDPARYGTERVSKIKQVASGRFGVTAEYLVNAEVIQIKIAQGAKPGEGGQLPGHKVNEMIARLRYAKPGVGLISPPPHHDIYSIEDLAQLIFDLKQVNPDALVSVKLVAEPGVGTIAAGVVKAYADLITISGYDGGTGASPLSSVKYAGSPWELGLSEAHQVLRANDLRHKVRLQTDGGLKTGLDVIKAAMLGAESFGFGTAPMIALGCKYLRICHLNNCATGVATQNNVLRSEHFIGLPGMVINFFTFVAQEVRERMAAIGARRMDDIIGRADLLASLEGQTERQRRLDLSPLVADGGLAPDKPRFCTDLRNEPFDEAVLANEMLEATRPAIEDRKGGRFEFAIRNFDRSIGAMLSGEIARRYGNNGMQDAPLDILFVGYGRPELRRLERLRPESLPHWRHQRLRRQRYDRRQHRCASA